MEDKTVDEENGTGQKQDEGAEPGKGGTAKAPSGYMKQTGNALKAGLGRIGEGIGEIAERMGPKRKQAPDAKEPTTLIELGCEMWRLCKSCEEWSGRLGERRARRARNQIAWSQTRLRELLGSEEIELRDLEGQVWTEGDPVKVINPPSGTGHQALRIGRMLEPVVMYGGRAVRHGKAVVEDTEGEQR